jgi:hypothetical protein
MSFLALLSAVTTVILFLAREEAVEIIASFIARFRK